MKVTFLPSGEEHEIDFNETILHLAQRKGLHIQSVCKGIPSCAECRIQIKEGEHHVLPPSKKEIDLIGTAHYIDRSRLSCQLRCFGDVTVDLSEQIEKEKRATSKPKDRMARRDGKESHAVLGGILDDVVAEGEALPEEDLEKKEVVKVEEFKGDPKLDRKGAFYGDFLGGGERRPKKNKGPRNRNNRQDRGQNPNQGKPNQQQAKTPGEGGQQRPDGQNPGRNKKRRNKNRNRNRQNNNQSNNPSNSASE